MKTAGTISISVALRSILVAALGLGLMFATSPLLTGLTIAILPLLLIALRIYSTLNKRYTREGLACSAEASTVAEEVFGSIRTVCFDPRRITDFLSQMVCGMAPSPGSLHCSTVVIRDVLLTKAMLGHMKGQLYVRLCSRLRPSLSDRYSICR